MRLLAPFILVGLLCGAIGTLVVAWTYSGQLNEHMQRRGESIAAAINLMMRDVLEHASDDERDASMARFVNDLSTLPDLTLVVVVTGEPPVVTASTRSDWIGLLMSDLPYERVQEDLFDAIETRRMHPHFHWDTLEYDVSWPLALSISHRPRGEPGDGAVMLHLDARPVRAQLTRAAAETVGAMLLAIFGAAGLLWMLTDRLVLRRVAHIEAAMGSRSEGNVSASAPELGGDEIGRLAMSFNSMLAALNASERALGQARDHLEEQVRDRTADVVRTNQQLRVELEERLRAEQALKESHDRLRQADRMALIGTLAAGVAHDLHNLLLPVRLRVELLARMSESPHEREAIDDLQQSVRFLQQLAESLRMCALESVDRREDGAETDVQAWWSQVGGLLERAFRTRTESRGAIVRAHIANELPRVAVAGHRLTQAVLNLFVNAGDACRGHTDAAISLAARFDAERGLVCLEVIDNGCGMTPETLASAFDPFFTTKRRGASTGLGLSIVRGIAETAGGFVEVATAPGDGATFRLWLRAVGSDALRDPPAERTAAVTLLDERLASFATAALTEAGLHAAAAPGAPAPDADFWLLDADHIDIEALESFLRSEPHRGVVIVGDGQNEGFTSPRIARISVYFEGHDLLHALAQTGIDRDEAAAHE